MIKKKQATSPPHKITVKDNYYSPRNAPQEAIVSDTSIGNAEELSNRQTAKFYSPEYRVENSHQAAGKAKSPQMSKRTTQSKTALSTGQKTALAELEKAKQSKMLKSNTERVRVPSNEQEQPWNSMGSPKKKTNKPISIIQEQTWESGTKELPEVYAGQTFSSKELIQPEIAEFQYVFPNGDRYNGTWRGKYIEGSGVYDFTKQNLQYRGEFKESKQHGRGTLLRKPMGNNQRQDIIYEGEWMNGFKQGFGKYYYFKDTFYEGNWVKNTKQGHGTFKNSEGEYTGEWKNDKKHGRGSLKLNNGTILEGEFENDAFIEGTVVYSNGDRYEGDFQKFSRHGYGTYTYGRGQAQYKGKWENNSKSGTGVITYANGDRYEGGVVNNRREGALCQYEWKDTGDKISGQFIGDLPKRGRIFVNGEGEYEFNLLK